MSYFPLFIYSLVHALEIQVRISCYGMHRFVFNTTFSTPLSFIFTYIGGPLLKKSQNGWQQVGVVSFGANPCNNAQYPVMHANVYDFKSWIQNVMDGDYSQCA